MQGQKDNARKLLYYSFNQKAKQISSTLAVSSNMLQSIQVQRSREVKLLSIQYINDEIFSKM